MASPGVGGSLSAASDVLLDNPSNEQVLKRDAGYWKNLADEGQAVTHATLPAGTTLTIAKSGSTWPARPTDRSDIVVVWKGPDPSPTIVTSGTGGMLDNVDLRYITP